MLIQKHHSRKVVSHEISSTHLDASTLLSSTRILLFALSAGVLVASLYYVQPFTSMLAASLGVSVPQAGYLVTATQIGYVLGIVFLVPLSDVLNRRKLLTCMLIAKIARCCWPPAARTLLSSPSPASDGHHLQRPDGGHRHGGLVCARA